MTCSYNGIVYNMKTTKICCCCKIEKNVSEFSKHSKKADGFQPRCKLCKRLYDNKYNQEHPKVKNVIRERREAKRNSIRKIICNYLMEHPCVDCGETDIIVLEFDHIHDKVRNISQMVNNEVSIKNIMIEIDKCEVRCANCHRRKTAKQFNTYRNALFV